MLIISNLLNSVYSCVVPPFQGLFIPYNIVKPLKAAASRVDMSPVINKTSDFVDKIFIEECKTKASLNGFECDARIDGIHMWNVRMN